MRETDVAVSRAMSPALVSLSFGASEVTLDLPVEAQAVAGVVKGELVDRPPDVLPTSQDAEGPGGTRHGRNGSRSSSPRILVCRKGCLRVGVRQQEADGAKVPSAARTIRGIKVRTIFMTSSRSGSESGP